MIFEIASFTASSDISTSEVASAAPASSSGGGAIGKAEATSELMPSSVFRRRQKGATALYSLWYCRCGKCILAAISPSHLRGGNGGER